MANWTTPLNNTGRRIDGKRLVDFQNYVIQNANVFGLTVLATKVPTALDPINIDSARIEIETMVKRAVRGFFSYEMTSRFISICNSAGVGLDQGPVIVSGVTGLAKSNELQLSFDLDWDAYVPEDGGDVLYDIQVWDTDANPDELILTLTDQPFGTLTVDDALINSLTNYKARIRATWNGGASYTPWSAFVTMATTAPAAPTGLAVSNETTTGADIEWDAKVIEDFDVTYDVSVHLAADDSVVDSSLNQVGLTYTTSGLTTGTNYYVKVRAKWTDGSVKNTAYSANVAFTTT